MNEEIRRRLEAAANECSSTGPGYYMDAEDDDYSWCEELSDHIVKCMAPLVRDLAVKLRHETGRSDEWKRQRNAALRSWTDTKVTLAETEIALNSYKPSLDEVARERDQAIAELEACKGVLAELTEQHQQVMAEECPSDEKHCTCVPILRTGIVRLNAQLAVACKTLQDIADDKTWCTFGVAARVALVEIKEK